MNRTRSLALAIGLFSGVALLAEADAALLSPLNSLPPARVSVCLGACQFQGGEFTGGDLNQTFEIQIGQDGGFRAEFEPLGSATITITLHGLTVFGNIDPVQSLGMSVIDFGAPTSISVMFAAPMTPIAGAATWSSDFSADCTDVNSPGGNGPGDGCSLSPFLSPSDLVSYTVNGGIAIPGADHPGAALVHAGIAGVTTSESFGPFTAAGAFDCAAIGGCTSFSTRVSFTGSGGGDAFSISSVLRIDPAQVPEPATITLLGLGLAALGRWRRHGARR